ncbi:MAG: tRNA uridine-5-carboxymethylaminomethyl(34) synthesis GTPase MnmE [Bacteroidia bacterium]
MNFRQDDTIAAIATAAGPAAVGMIRISGKNAFSSVNPLFIGKDLTSVKSHTLHYGTLQHEGQTLDEVVIGIFRGPKSYTGEDVLEISCHGSSVVLERVMQALMLQGIRPAKAGEFTMRAFLNGKMDLSQAEAVADLINSESEAAYKTALFQMRGGFAEKIKQLRGRLVHFTALIELELDFAEEDVEFANRDQFRQLITEIKDNVSGLLKSFQLGNVIKKGVSVTIAGRPNAGKSTLLNALLQEERAIVSEIPGTTRDTIEDTISINGILFRFTDTAGIREAGDEIERIGIERTRQSIGKSNILIYLYDVNELTPAEVKQDLAELNLQQEPVVVGNKLDLSSEFKVLSSKFRVQSSEFKVQSSKFRVQGSQRETRNAEPRTQNPEPIYISSKTHEGIDQLTMALLNRVNLGKGISDYGVVTNLRHHEALSRASEAVRDVLSALDSGLTTDLLTVDIRRALQALGEITGEITTDEILGTIFSKFCIGK